MKNLLKKLTGFIKGGKSTDAPKSMKEVEGMVRKMDEDLPAGDRVAKKRDWISAKYKK